VAGLSRDAGYDCCAGAAALPAECAAQAAAFCAALFGCALFAAQFEFGKQLPKKREWLPAPRIPPLRPHNAIFRRSMPRLPKIPSLTRERLMPRG
jgi:hypothetical protein